MLILAVKNQTVDSVLNFRVLILLKDAVCIMEINLVNFAKTKLLMNITFCGWLIFVQNIIAALILAHILFSLFYNTCDFKQFALVIWWLLCPLTLASKN